MLDNKGRSCQVWPAARQGLSCERTPCARGQRRNRTRYWRAGCNRTRMSPNDAATRAMTQNGTNLQRGRASLIALWLTQVALALMFLMAGGSKLAGVPPMVSLFDAIGLGQWFRYVTGVIEVTSGIALLVPR